MAPSVSRETRNRNPAAVHASCIIRFDSGNMLRRYIESMLSALPSTVIVTWVLTAFLFFRLINCGANNTLREDSAVEIAYWIMYLYFIPCTHHLQCKRNSPAHGIRLRAPPLPSHGCRRQNQVKGIPSAHGLVPLALYRPNRRITLTE